MVDWELCQVFVCKTACVEKICLRLAHICASNLPPDKVLDAQKKSVGAATAIQAGTRFMIYYMVRDSNAFVKPPLQI